LIDGREIDTFAVRARYVWRGISCVSGVGYYYLHYLGSSR
jgi:hypothetical protein